MGPITHQSNASSSYPHIKMSSKKPFEQDVILCIICKQGNRFQEESPSHCLHIQEKYWDMECWNVDRLTNWHAQACSSQKRTSETNQKNRNITYGDVKLARGVNFNNVGLLLCKRIIYIYFVFYMFQYDSLWSDANRKCFYWPQHQIWATKNAVTLLMHDKQTCCV